MTQEQLDAMDAAIVRAASGGALRVRIGEKEIQYQSLKDMLTARALWAASIASELTPTRAQPRHKLADFSD